MKKLLSILFLLVGLMTYSQTNIEGIGFLKLKKTKISVIDSLQTEGYRLLTCNDFYNCSEYKIVGGKRIYEKINNGNYTPDMPFIKGHRSFVISEITIANVPIKYLELQFYNDVLFKIKCTNGDSELRKALELKYSITPTLKTNKITCRSIYGSFEEEENTFTSTYRFDSQIEAQSIFAKYFDSKCKPQYLTYTIIADIKTSKEVSDKEKEVNSDKKNKEDLERKKQLEKL